MKFIQILNTSKSWKMMYIYYLYGNQMQINSCQLHFLLDSIVVSISACQTEDEDSIHCWGEV